MKRKSSTILLAFIFTLLFLLLPPNTSCEEEEGKKNQLKTRAHSKGRANKGKSKSGKASKIPISKDLAADLFHGEKCYEGLFDVEKYQFTRVHAEGGCMLIHDEMDIPESLKGEKSFSDPCSTDPRAGKEHKCKQYVNVGTCLKPTHLTCDPYRKICVCSYKGEAIADIRFQFGTDTTTNSKKRDMDKKNGRCLIRPSFETIFGFDCSPGSKPFHVPIDEDEDSPHSLICGCKSTFEFNAKDALWWKCDGSLIIANGFILLFALWLNFLVVF